MKCRSTESPSASATLYPPWTMRVQPHLPSRPLTTTVIESPGFAWCACSAANSPAPPAPRIRISVCRRRIGKAFKRPLAMVAPLSTAQAHARAVQVDELGERDAVFRRRRTRETHAGGAQCAMYAGDIVGVQA